MVSAMNREWVAAILAAGSVASVVEVAAAAALAVAPAVAVAPAAAVAPAVAAGSGGGGRLRALIVSASVGFVLQHGRNQT